LGDPESKAPTEETGRRLVQALCGFRAQTSLTTSGLGAVEPCMLKLTMW
jgi:hypothetical protein